ncbi:hypothetical protein DCAR_0103820 [Daucus carota subsp. sativus]|uniref:Uncharacterized protein n=1 Tax=Daucus carota subsp. sativus TaxID=79200 RepID=A0A166IB91_DAUCS|nr:hypothetical protein DCAR_0103820 [Daucus carota subsp. sativus]
MPQAEPPTNSVVRAVPLVGQDGTKVEALSICHLDTASWSSSHFAFLVMDAKPGSPVCHFLAEAVNVAV